jgi:hypothetical protein
MRKKQIYDSIPNERNSAIITINEWLSNEKTGSVLSALMSLTMIVERPYSMIIFLRKYQESFTFNYSDKHKIELEFKPRHKDG